MNRFLSDTPAARRLLLISLIVTTILVWAAVGGLFMLRSRAGEPVPATPTVPPTTGPAVTVAANSAGGFTVSGFDWPANVAVELSLVPATGTPVYWLGTVRSDDSGAFQVNFDWRAGQPGGEGTLLLARSGTAEAATPFTLAPPPSLTPVIPGETPPASPTAEPTATATPSPVPPTATILSGAKDGGAAGPVCLVAGNALNLRAGPGTNYGVTLVLQRSEELDPIARSSDGSWIQVVTFDNIVGWVVRDFITCQNVDLNRLPVVAVAPTPAPVPPTATPVPPTPTPVYITDWRGEYFNNAGLVGTPIVIRNDLVINFDWGLGAPAPVLPADNFSARWTRWWRFAPGPYRFHLRADDGARLYVDNSLVLEMWDQGPARTQTVALNLPAGDHFIQVDYFEAGGEATVALWWEEVGTITGWKGEYFDNRNLSGTPMIVRDDAAINFNWGTAAPAPGLPADNFSARWRRDLTFDAGTYRFSLRADDGVRFWIDGNLVIDEWHPASATYTAEVYLGAGTHSLRVEYFEATGGAIIVLDWERVGQQFLNWKGEYYNNEDPEGDPVLVRNDVNIAFDWGEESPGRGVNKDHFSVRWTGRPEMTAGTYRFHVSADDGVRLWVNGVLVLDKWDGKGGDFVAEVVIPSDGSQQVRVEYFEETGEAEAHLWWELLLPTPTATPTVTATTTATPTATQVPPTATSTATAVPPTATATTTATPTATPTATATVAPSWTPRATLVPPTATPKRPTPTVPKPHGPVAFRTVAQGMQDYSFVRRPVYTAFHTAAEWDAFVQTMRALDGTDADAKPIPLQNVKWAREVALAAFLGERPDNSVRVRITQIELGPEGLVVTVAQTKATDASRQVATTPFHIVAVKRGALPVGALDVVFVNRKGEVLGRDTLQVAAPAPPRPGDRDAGANRPTTGQSRQQSTGYRLLWPVRKVAEG